MEIPEKKPLQSLPAQNRSADEPTQPTAAQTGSQEHTAAGDTVSLTEKGSEFKAAVRQAHQLPDIRENRVMQLKRQIEQGTYRLKGHRIAAGMIDETLENNQILRRIDTRA